jgi:3-deoxy-D-arabino-heptulosonate 7-phosphate (DAHP) synthase class II
MKLDLTLRDIELMLMLMHEAATLDTGENAQPVFTMEEMALIDKLETALKREEILSQEIFDTSVSTLTH